MKLGVKELTIIDLDSAKAQGVVDGLSPDLQKRA